LGAPPIWRPCATAPVAPVQGRHCLEPLTVTICPRSNNFVSRSAAVPGTILTFFFLFSFFSLLLPRFGKRSRFRQGLGQTSENIHDETFKPLSLQM
jgi:hypothetical protein